MTTSTDRRRSVRHRWLLVTAVVAVLLSASPGIAELNTAPTRFDLSAQDPGDQVSEELFVKNRGDERVEVNVTTETVHREDVTVTPQSFALEGGENETLAIEVTLPENATGGRHDVRIRLLEQVPESGEGQVTVRDATLVPMVFNVRNLAVANVRLGPAEDQALPVETVVRNGLPSSVNASLELRLSSGERTLSNLTVPTGLLDENETSVVRTDVPVDRLAPGDYRIQATAVHETNRSNTWTEHLQLGAENLEIVDVRAEPGGEEPTSLTAEIANEAPVGLEVDVTFAIRQNGTEVDEITSTTHTVPPQAHGNVTVERNLEPGEYEIQATGGWPGAADGPRTTMNEPAEDDEGWLPIPSGQAAVLAALAVASALGRRRLT